MLPDAATFIAELGEAKEKHHQLMQEYHVSLWQSIKTHRSKDRQERLAIWLKSIKSAQAGIEWQQQRKSPPRCLECSSTNIEAANFDRKTPHPYELAMMHPNCGGRLLVQESDVRLATRGAERDYDPEGVRQNPPLAAG